MKGCGVGPPWQDVVQRASHPGGRPDRRFVVPEDRKANKQTWENFQKFSSEYKRIRAVFEGTKNRPLEFRKRLRYFIKTTEKNKQVGFGGIEKYY